MMRLVRRNLKTVYYCLLDHKEKVLDDDGNWTGEWKYIYAQPVATQMVCAPSRGYLHADYYGRLDSWERTVVSADMSLPIDVSTMIYLDKEPEFDDDGNPTNFNYSVRRVAPALNTILYSLMEVKTE